MRRRDWSTIATVSDIASRLPNDADYVRFRSVCSFWRVNAPKRPHLPWLLFEQDDHSLALCNFPSTQLFHTKLPDDIVRKKFICGSSQGWIAILNSRPGIILHNPFTAAQIKLPLLEFDDESLNGTRIKKEYGGFAYYKSGQSGYTCIDRFKDIHTSLASKVVLSSDPSDENCVAMALRYDGEKLIYSRPRVCDSWNILSHPCEPQRVQDIVFYNGKFYVVWGYKVYVCYIGPDSRVMEILPATPLFSDGLERRQYVPIRKSYLVVSCGDLLLVTITRPSSHYEVPEYICEVFRVDFDSEMLKLLKLESLDGRALFLGEESVSLAACSSSGCKANCIYFSHRDLAFESEDLDTEWVHTINVFSMEDEGTSCITGLSNAYYQAHWITPSLLN